jgi:hypothetical protein
MAPLGPSQRREYNPQGHELIHPLDGIPPLGRAGRRFQNRHRTHPSSPLVTQSSHAIARCVGVVLLAAAALKLPALGMRSPSLELPHPLLPWLPTWQVVLVAALIQAFAGLGTLASRRQGPVLAAPSMCLATLSGCLAISTWLNLESPSVGLGPIGHWFHWSPATERAITLWALLGCLLLMTVAWWSHLRNGGGVVHGPLPVPHRSPA